jgi:hypothetical protein
MAMDDMDVDLNPWYPMVPLPTRPSSIGLWDPHRGRIVAGFNTEDYRDLNLKLIETYSNLTSLKFHV